MGMNERSANPGEQSRIGLIVQPIALLLFLGGMILWLRMTDLTETEQATLASKELRRLTFQHINLTIVAAVIVLATAIPAGIILTRRRRGAIGLRAGHRTDSGRFGGVSACYRANGCLPDGCPGAVVVDRLEERIDEGLGVRLMGQADAVGVLREGVPHNLEALIGLERTEQKGVVNNVGIDLLGLEPIEAGRLVIERNLLSLGGRFI